MKSKILFVLAFCLCLSAVDSFAQKSKEKSNAEITKMLRDISAKNIETTIRRLVSFGTRNTLSEQDNPTRGIGAARDYLFGEFQKISADCGNCLTVEKQTFLQPKANRIPEPTNLTNVIATLRGTTDPTRFYVVSGHYDSMCSSPTDAKCDAPGANDDASGTAAVVELARVMSKMKFDATIVFMAVPGEEQGLLGAAYYAEQAKKNNQNIEAMFTNDIIGGVTSYKNSPTRQTVRVFAEGVPTSETEQEAATRRSVGGENDSSARQLARYIQNVGNVYSPRFRVQVIYRRDRYGRGGDHIPFLERGFAAVRFSEPNEDYAHQHQNVGTRDGKFYGDTIEFVDFNYVANVARINAAALANLALAPAKPKNVNIITGRLTNDTDLKWDANADADLAGYEIVWRATDSPVWTNSQFVGAVTNYTMKEMSKDNFFFGVRAIDKNGNRSPVVFPRPAAPPRPPVASR
jgi:Zn-dependent M28 family amino/carboxypeptidase